MTTRKIWINHHLNPEQRALLERVAEGHELVLRPGARSAPELADCDAAFGQPPLADAIKSPRLRWVQLSSAGFGSYDTPEARAAFAAREAVLTKSSFVYATPCASHVLAFMLAWARRLPQAWENQRTERGWPQSELRSQSQLLEGQSVTLVGFGSIGQRLVELLRPFGSRVVGARTRPRGDEGIETFEADSPRLLDELGRSDHVVNLLPGTDATRHFFDRRRLRAVRSGAVFYNVGRGSSVDQDVLAELLHDGQLAAALLDVTDPEPLPHDHPLWTAPNCLITPHAAGGHSNEGDRLVRHFADNLQRFLASEPVQDRAY